MVIKRNELVDEKWVSINIMTLRKVDIFYRVILNIMLSYICIIT